MAIKPIIAITGSDSKLPIAWWASALGIRLAGGSPLHLTPSNYKLYNKTSFNAIIIGGGHDIDPIHYAETEIISENIDPKRDEFEIEMIQHALAIDLPILGICRGMQLINIVLGGKLYHDICPLRQKTSNKNTPFPSKTAVIEAQSRLFNILKTTKCRINSLHHQAIKELGNDLVAVAHDEDGFIQAIESTTSQFIVGTQWHPEYLTYFNKQRRLFNSLVKEAKQHRAKKLL